MTWSEKEKILGRILNIRKEEQSWKKYYQQNKNSIIDIQEQTVLDRLEQLVEQREQLENLIK